MIISGDKLETAFRKAKQIKEHADLYCLDPLRIPVSIEDLQWVIQDIYGLTIEKHEVSFRALFLRGMVERYEENKARILVRQDQSDDWKRFITGNYHFKKAAPRCLAKKSNSPSPS